MGWLDLTCISVALLANVCLHYEGGIVHKRNGRRRSGVDRSRCKFAQRLMRSWKVWLFQTYFEILGRLQGLQLWVIVWGFNDSRRLAPCSSVGRDVAFWKSGAYKLTGVLLATTSMILFGVITVLMFSFPINPGSDSLPWSCVTCWQD